MSQVTQGIRSVLSIPAVYRLFGQLIGGGSGRKKLVNDYICPQQDDCILNIGCGLDVLVPYLPAVDYIGFDASEDYIQAAQAQYGDHARFYCKQVSAETISEQSQFDLVLAVGVLHHLDDAEALQLCYLAQAALKPGRRFITFDDCYLPEQSPIAHYLLTRDRGQNVRDQAGYTKIVSQVFSKDIVVRIRHDLLRIPYTHIILECTK